jgi:hypothetical protein
MVCLDQLHRADGGLDAGTVVDFCPSARALLTVV